MPSTPDDPLRHDRDPRPTAGAARRERIRKRLLSAACLVLAVLLALLWNPWRWPEAAGDRPVTKSGFKTPTAEDRARAVGSLANLEGINRRAFEPGLSFTPIADPQPGEWLAEH